MKLCQRDLFTRLLRARPLMTAALLYLAGCMLGHALLPPAALCAGALVFLACTALLCRRNRRITAALLALLFLPFGALRFGMDWRAVEPFPEQRNVALTGRICEPPVWKPETERTICVLEDIAINGVSQPGRTRLYLRGDVNLLQAVRLGQRIECRARIWRGDAAANPAEFDFDRYLRLNGLRGYATAEIEDAGFTAPEYRRIDCIISLRQRLTLRIDRLFPANSDLARAFLLGDCSTLNDETRENYNRSGVGHLLAISGMHVSVLAAFISLLLGRLMGRRGAYAATLALLVLYGGLLGFSASLLRAILMFAVYNLAPLAGRYSDSPTRLSAAMLVYLLIRPIAILDAGFILSYGATAGILLMYVPLQRLFHAYKFLHSKPRNGFVAIFTNRLPKYLIQSLLVSLAAQLATLPAVVHFFGAQPLWSLAANLVVIPLAMSTYVLAIAAAIIGIPFLAALPDFLFGAMADCVSFFGGLPMAALTIARFPLWLALCCALSCFLASDLSRLPEKLRRFLPLTVILAVFISNGCAALSARNCSIVFMAAGEADCAVVRTEGNIYLIDTGDSYTPAADYISAMNYHVNGVFLSHPHADHAAGLSGVLEVCTPDQVYISANWNQYEPSDSVRMALDAARDQGCEIIELAAGDTIALSGKTLLEVLPLSAGISSNPANDDSLVFRLTHGDCSAVFTGDASYEALEGGIGDADILKISHHGALDGTSAALLAEVTPSAVIVSTGENSYGHPALRVLDLLEASGAAVYRTDLHGAVTCRMNPDGSAVLRPYFASEEAS